MHVDPFYFTSGDDQLLGLFHQAEGHQKKSAVLICYPAPQEIMRSHASHVLLSKKLQELGYPVLRFDYAATGDSTGEEASLARWQQNVISALIALKRKSGLQQITVIGTRLGARLALAASCSVSIKQLILWDPIAEGRCLVDAYETAHHKFLYRNPVEPPFGNRQAVAEQICGFAFSQKLRSEILELNPLNVKTQAQELHIIEPEQSLVWQQIAQRLRSEGRKVEHAASGEPMLWDHDLYMKIRMSPAKCLRMILASVKGAA